MSGMPQYQKSDFENHIKTLNKLGFSKDEALIYHVILSSKESTVGEISRSINFSRAKIYGLIDNLLSEGVIVEGSSHPKSYYPVDPREIAEKRLKEVEEAVSWIKPFNIPLSLLHCVLNYPTLDSNANLGMIRALQNAFPNNIIGYSDHTLPGNMKICEMAVMLGARIIEKHFTHDKSLPGNDHYHAMDKDDLMLFNSNMDSLLDILGSFQIQSLASEKKARLNARRSIVAAKDIPKGKIIDREDLTFKRPAHGISPKFISTLIGSCAKEDIKEDDIIIEDHIQ